MNSNFISGLVEGQIDPSVYEHTLKTHAKESIALPKFGNISLTPADNKTIARAQFSECEISPFRLHEHPCHTQEEPLFSREASVNQFAAKMLSLEALEKLLIHSFSPNNKGHRPYPSAGGLYPIEPLVFLFPDRIDTEESLFAGCYHFRSISQSLQLIKKMESDDFFEQLIHGLISKENRPNLGILYIAHIGKSIFKYRYRGYRHALMEAGSMYQQASIISQEMGLRTTAWSSFSDPEIMSAIGLDGNTYLPITMQFIGWGKE